MSKTASVAIKEGTGKTQWNCRIHPEYRRVAKIVSAMTDYTQDELAELGLAVLFGVDTDKEDSAVNRCRAKVMSAAKRTGERLPFKHFATLIPPLTQWGHEMVARLLPAKGAGSLRRQYRHD